MKKWLLFLLVIGCFAGNMDLWAKNNHSKDFKRKMIKDKKQAQTMLQWYTNIDAAIADASANNRQILLVISGSDWCPPCKKLEKQVLSHKDFKKIASQSLVLVKADFPRKAQKPEIKKQAQEVVRRYPYDGFPTVYLLGPDGKVLDKKVGFADESVKSFLKKFKGYKAPEK